MSGEVTKKPDTAAEDTATSAIDDILDSVDNTVDEIPVPEVADPVAEIVPVLNSAGVMPSVTSIETGPAEMVFMLMALILSAGIMYFMKKPHQGKS